MDSINSDTRHGQVDTAEWADRFIQQGVQYQQNGRLQEAAAIYQQILEIMPNHPEALHLLGLIATQTGQLEMATVLIRKAIGIRPTSTMHYNLGNALHEQNQLDTAIEHYKEAISIEPNNAKVHNNLGIALHKQGKLDAAAESFCNAVLLDPASTDAYNNLGLALLHQGKFDAAIENYRKALEIDPKDVVAHNSLGLVLQKQGQLEAAIHHFRAVLSISGDDVRVYNDLGVALQMQGKQEEAMACFQKVLSIASDDVATHNKAHSNLLYSLCFHPHTSPALYLQEARRYGQKITASVEPYTDWPVCHQKHTQRLRIGLVSGDFRNHPVGIFLESILPYLSKGRLELIAYSTNAAEDMLTARIKPYFTDWKFIGRLNDNDAAKQILDDEIHILMDLSGHTAHNRLPVFARKPAPVQVTWLGYFASTGLPTMDYILCDAYGLPSSESNQFTETPWYLPNTRLCFTPPESNIPIAPLPALKHGAVTFGCFNNLAKVTDEVVELWATILHAVKGSRLFLKSRQLSESSIQQNTRARFAAYGIDHEQLILQGPSPRHEYLETYNQVDIALDPFPYTGATTSVEGLWMGVPFLTRQGDRHLARQGEGIWRNIGLTDWIAADNADYVAKAIKQANGDLPLLNMLRNRLRNMLLGSPLCDAQLFAWNMEHALHEMWQKSCKEKIKWMSG